MTKNEAARPSGGSTPKPPRRRSPSRVFWAVVGLALGWFLWGSTGSAPTADPHAGHDPDAIAEEERQPEWWTCSMHPQIQQPAPGQCPLCAMDLIPLEASSAGGLREVTLMPETRDRLSMRTFPVERRHVETEVRMVGKVVFDETRLSEITAWVSGRIDRLYVDYTGVTVRKGDHMVDLYSPELYATQRELLSARQLTEIPTAFGSSISSNTTYEAARERLRLFGLSEEQIDAIEARGTPSPQTTIHAPTGGLVIHKQARQGMYVSTGEHIFTIADLDRVWIQLDAYESDLTWLRYGQHVTFETEAWPGQRFDGTISFLDPVLDPITRTVKVRVLADNLDGRLKPGLFVRATVRAKVAAQGKVMDPDLIGKWVSPMHPEIVKDGPGTCDVCGMDLVPAESLGYVSAADQSLQAPLVIPRQAALVTGRRAVVYVELPDRDDPTYEGRQIVLGPRAGEHYLVLHGLEEGERVVVDGAFKLDASLQIRARPSMMSPDGGGSSGHEHHSDHADKAGPDDEVEAVTVDGLTEAGRHQLQRVERAITAVRLALEGTDAATVSATFSGLASTLEDFDATSFTGDALAQWNELAMRLGNDAYEGRTASTPEDQSAAGAALALTTRSLRTRLGTHAEGPAPDLGPLPPATRAALVGVRDAYADWHAALAGDDEQQAHATASELRRAAATLGKAPPPPNATVWTTLTLPLTHASASLDDIAPSDLEALRVALEPISTALANLFRVTGPPDDQALFVVHCPMAFDFTGADWLQTDEAVLNPYFGASMLRCGSVVEQIVTPDADR